MMMMMKIITKQRSLITLLIFIAIIIPYDYAVKLNEIQVKGTHNSYHHRNPNCVWPTKPCFREWNYGHSSLTTQLNDEDVRQFEFDFTYYEGGGALREKFPIVHVPIYDEFSSCSHLYDCLSELKQWSDTVGSTQPLIFVHLELKNAHDLSDTGWNQLDSLLTSVYPLYRTLIPDRVRTSSDRSIHDSVVIDKNWPHVNETGGMIMFVFDKPHENYYRDSNLRHRIVFPMFPYANRSNENCAVVAANYPPHHHGWIETAVSEGFIVRTRADSSFPMNGPYTQLMVDDTIFYIITKYSNDPQRRVSIDEIYEFADGLLHQPLPISKNLLEAGIFISCSILPPYPLSHWPCVMSFARSHLAEHALPNVDNVPTLAFRLYRRDLSINTGAHMITTDYPVVKLMATGDAVNYSVTLDYTYQCNERLLNISNCDPMDIQTAVPARNPNDEQAKHNYAVLFIALGVCIAFGLSMCYYWRKRISTFKQHTRLNEADEGEVIMTAL